MGSRLDNRRTNWVVSHYKDGKEVGQRLVCQYLQIAFYKGNGSPETRQVSNAGLLQNHGDCHTPARRIRLPVRDPVSDLGYGGNTQSL
jgi:hypothetical protein